jgi:hypothetical protein
MLTSMKILALGLERLNKFEEVEKSQREYRPGRFNLIFCPRMYAKISL